METREKTKKLLLKQLIMRKVLLALVPCAASSIYFFGWRSLFVILWSALVGFWVEYIFTRTRGEPVTESIFVTTTIFALIMPPTIPVHILTIGIVFAVMFSKEIFGGFGKNIFNPAMAGRLITCLGRLRSNLSLKRLNNGSKASVNASDGVISSTTIVETDCL